MSSSMASRSRRRDDVEYAYALQAKAGAWGAFKYGLYGAGLMTLLHNTWPVFKRQTLAFKGFLTMGFVCFGLITHAEDALLLHERQQRISESRLRNEARIDLAKRGLVCTESAIAKWKDERAARLQAEAQQCMREKHQQHQEIQAWSEHDCEVESPLGESR